VRWRRREDHDEIGAQEVSSVSRSAREVVELYNLVVWNERDFALAEELMGDTVIRHEVGEAQTLTHEQAVQRIVDHWALFETVRFDLNLVVAGDDGEHVAIVYQSPMELKDGTKTDVGGMEIFRVIDGRITEVWNCGYKQGIWQ
jgi:predicted SnoaL-like aldol condensation-catalyzing enzyme